MNMMIMVQDTPKKEKAFHRSQLPSPNFHLILRFCCEDKQLSAEEKERLSKENEELLIKAPCFLSVGEWAQKWTLLYWHVFFSFLEGVIIFFLGFLSKSKIRPTGGSALWPRAM